MATSSISGLASGLDTATIIDQLMQLEAVPQTKLSSQKDTENDVIKALRQLNTDTTLLAGNAGKLAKAETWQTLKGTSSSGSVSVAVGATASAASFSVTVDRLATSHQLGFTDAANLTDVVSGSTVKLTGSDGVVHDIAVGGGTLEELVAGINGSTADTGVAATAIKVADGSYRLLVESTETGAASAFTLTDGDGTDLLGGSATRAGSDAQISLGLGITATSATNTFTDLAPGITLTLGANAKVGDTATVTVAQNSSSISSSVSDLVDQLNSLLTSIDSLTAPKTETTSAGVLSGDPTARSLRGQLLNTIFGDSTTSMAQYGIQTDRYGKLVFDKDKFAKAYAEDPAGVAAKFATGATPETNGWAARVEAVTKSATDSYDGTITNAITGHTSTVDRLTKSIDDWDNRLELRRTSLERQYTALETALSNLQSQSSWLASQISSLPTYA
ncbi:flagellar filament capping protein FliD [Nocardioides sp. YIM 152315]|uniref:flagellar filament capping protein FliD n=1 Tax=Nocardioides sp. YIM 152315 TaxID=3031760 RepID=UPI0023DAC945|nr:flagellar filament capping protein FliD [Nocardioides sp. YIM 152315]MDF1605956.1 flagellar filament capping protein FliD [Nocardioides sp. YIM 152315]